MSDRMKHIPPVLMTAEVRAAAHELRAVAERLLALVEALPLPPANVRKVVYNATNEEFYKEFPTLELYVDVRELAGGQLLELAGELEEVGKRPVPLVAKDA